MHSQQRLLTRVETSVCCILIVSWVFHGFDTNSCFYFVFKSDLPHITFEKTYQWRFWLQLNHSERKKIEWLSFDDPLSASFPVFNSEEQEQVFTNTQLTTKTRCGNFYPWTFLKILSQILLCNNLQPHCFKIGYFVILQW